MPLKNKSMMLLLVTLLSLTTQAAQLTQNLQPQVSEPDTIMSVGEPALFTGVLVSPESYRSFSYYKEAYTALKEECDPQPESAIVRFQLGDWKLIAGAGVLGLGLGYLAFHH